MLYSDPDISFANLLPIYRNVHDVRNAVAFSVPLGNDHFKKRQGQHQVNPLVTSHGEGQKLGWLREGLIELT